MTLPKARCLILACGNTLRGDDGIGPWLAAWAEEHYRSDARVQVLAQQQWTPELALEIATAESVVFVDCSTASAPGSVNVVDVQPAKRSEGLATHHLNAAELLELARELYDSPPRAAALMTVGAGSTELGEEFSPAVNAAIPEACAQLERTLVRVLADPQLPAESQRE